MDIEIEKQLTIKVKGKDIENLKSVVEKMSKELRSVGFRSNNITTDEQKVINEFNELLNKN